MMMIALALAFLQAPLPAPVAVRAADRYPFAVGESFQYSAKLGMINLGSGSMDVVELDSVRGVETFKFRFTIEGGALFFKIKDVLESWTGTGDFVTRRFRQDYLEDDKPRLKEFEIFPDSGYYRVNGRTTTSPTTAEPLDDTAFFYFIRTTPLVVGQTYQYDRYFQKALNPVTVKVSKREKLELPDGRKVDCLLLQPLVKHSDMFGERSDARIWLTDDSLRIPVQIRSTMAFGTVTLRLKSLTLGGHPTAAKQAGQ
jgi:hypothetical protein